MLKKFFLATFVGLIICAAAEAEAKEIYVGTSPVTNYECYVLTDTIGRDYDDRLIIYSARLKTVDRYGDSYYIDYKFYSIDNDTEDVQFTNSEGFKGIVDSYDTPIEWAMFMVVRDY